MTKSRMYQIASLIAGACVFAYLVLALAQVSLNEKACGLDLSWFGCVLRSHENLAGGLASGAMTLVAAWVAWIAVQDQIQADRVARTEDGRTAERLLIQHLEYYAEGLATAWEMIVGLSSQKPASIEQVRTATSEIIKVVTEPVAMAAYREMVKSLDWEKRLSFGDLLNELETLRAYKDANSLGDCSEVEGAIRRTSHFLESCIPDGHKYFSDLPQGSPKAWTLGMLAKHVANIND